MRARVAEQSAAIRTHSFEERFCATTTRVGPIDRAPHARGLERNLKSAANAAGCECEVDRTTELVRNKITNEADTVFAFGRSCNCGAADLSPYDRQVRRILAGSAVPVHLHPPTGSRQRAVFRSVRHQLVEHHR